MKSTQPILMDMDGVFCDFAGGYFALAKAIDPELYEQLMDREEQINYYCHDHITDPEIWKRGDALSNHPDLFGLLNPYPGSIEGMNLLRSLAAQRGIDVLICTAPHTTNFNSYTSKAKWISAYMGHDWLDKILMVRDKTIIRGSILVDDKPIPLGNYIPTWKHVVMPHPYNREQQKTNFVFGGWDKDSLTELIEYAQSNQG